MVCFIVYCRLKESLAEALAARGNAGEAQKFKSDSPAEATLNILNSILHGEQVIIEGGGWSVDVADSGSASFLFITILLHAAK